MSILKTLFGRPKTAYVEVEMDYEQLQAFEYFAELAKKENPDFNPHRYLGEILDAHFKKKFGRTLQDMINHGKPKKKGRKLRG